MGKLVKSKSLVGHTNQDRTRKFKVGDYTRVFEKSGQYGSKTDAWDAAKRLGDDYYFRITRIKVRDYGDPKRYQLWKKLKPGRA